MYVDLNKLLKGTNIASDPSPVKEVGNLTSGLVLSIFPCCGSVQDKTAP